MSNVQAIQALIAPLGVASHIGYAPSNAKLPYVVQRPLLINPESTAINGDAMDWDLQFALYACAGSVEASYNLALSLVSALQGARVGGSTLAVSTGYLGASVEGQYESQVTVQINQGGI